MPQMLRNVRNLPAALLHQQAVALLELPPMKVMMTETS